jgi:hypothetical protein
MLGIKFHNFIFNGEWGFNFGNKFQKVPKSSKKFQKVPKSSKKFQKVLRFLQFGQKSSKNFKKFKEIFNLDIFLHMRAV